MAEGEPGIDALLRPSRAACVAAEFFNATAHVPVTIALATLLAQSVADWPLLVPLLAGAFLQAWLIGARQHSGKAPEVLLHLIGAAIYAATLATANWQNWWSDSFMLVYAGSSLLIVVCMWVGLRLPGLVGEGAQVAANVVRALAVVAVYAVVASDDAGRFLVEPENRFLVVGIAMLGLALGVSGVVHRRDRTRLAEIAARLRQYSEMLLGQSRLHRAMGREDDLRPRRTRRSVLFADIRGFTKWSESRTPEEVLLMLDGVYGAAEQACAPFKPARTKHTGDEVMMFFSEPLAAAQAALALRKEVGSFLALYSLHVGIGLHHGEVIEGLVGASRTKAYDILGDTVNTAKRVSDHARPGGIVVTFIFFEACRGRIEIASDQRINAKGKSSAILVAELVGLKPAKQGQP